MAWVMILFPMLQFLLQVSLININLVKFCDNDFRFDASCAVCGHDIETTFTVLPCNFYYWKFYAADEMFKACKKDACKSMIRYNLKITQFQNCFQLYKILSNPQMPVNITSHVYIRIRDMTYLSLL
jgi:hypothetical protein